MTMKPTDLMLGDFVNGSPVSEFPMRVTLIDEGGCYLNFEGNEGDPFDGDFGDNGMQPIPLTPEVLKANGWEVFYDGVRFVHHFHNDDNHNVKYDKEAGIYTYHTIRFRYVHELQHIFRLCGKGDLADNFKIY